MKRWLVVAAALLLSALSGVVVAQHPCAARWMYGDLNCDGRINIYDFSILATNYHVPEAEWWNDHAYGTQLARKGVAWTGPYDDDLRQQLGAETWYVWSFGGRDLWRPGFVPMARTTPVPPHVVEQFTGVMGTGNYYLVFNEPNVGNQDNIEPQAAAELYRQHVTNIQQYDPDARFIVGGVNHIIGDWKDWLNGFWSALSPEERETVYGWHAHFYVDLFPQPGVQALDVAPPVWRDNIRWFVDWCHGHNGRECWDTEGPALFQPDAWYNVWFHGAEPGTHRWAECEGMTCQAWWRRQFDATFHWCAWPYEAYSGALIDGGELTAVGEMFAGVD